MPVTTERKAIRFPTKKVMLGALRRDDVYQHRHLVIAYLCGKEGSATRKEVSQAADVPINAISKVVSTLLEEGVLKDTGHMICKVTGRKSRSIQFNESFAGMY